jgi:hypothetical protein
LGRSTAAPAAGAEPSSATAASAAQERTPVLAEQVEPQDFSVMAAAAELAGTGRSASAWSRQATAETVETAGCWAAMAEEADKAEAPQPSLMA